MTVPDFTRQMTPGGNRELARKFLMDFAQVTGLEPEVSHPRRYLWTDAFAVCTCLGLFQKTGKTDCRELALRLIGQVHHTLGQYRDDDTRTGWINGLSSVDGEMHPTAGGLRIGKSLPERRMGEPYNEQREWDQDGQYFHYLTKWMHALTCATKVTGNPVYRTWAVELARTAHARFTYLPAYGTRKRMYWKMSTDLTRPLVTSMGQHDPLDGLVTYREIQHDAGTGDGQVQLVLVQEIAEIADIGHNLPLATDDPLGIGGLLFDATRVARLAVQNSPVNPDLLERVMDSALTGLESFAVSGSLELPARYRLAFRELGLSIGIVGIEYLPSLIQENPHLSKRAGSLLHRVEALKKYVPLRKSIEEFWLVGKNRESVTWTEHQDINTVMLATSLAPDGFLEM